MPSDQRTVAVSSAQSTLLVGPNPNRRALIVSSGPTNRFTLSFKGDAVLDAGITIPPNTSPFVVGPGVCGCIMEGPVTAISAVADQNVTYVEEFKE